MLKSLKYKTFFLSSSALPTLWFFMCYLISGFLQYRDTNVREYKLLQVPCDQEAHMRPISFWVLLSSSHIIPQCGMGEVNLPITGRSDRRPPQIATFTLEHRQFLDQVQARGSALSLLIVCGAARLGQGQCANVYTFKPSPCPRGGSNLDCCQGQ